MMYGQTIRSKLSFLAHSEDPNSEVSSSSTPPHGGDYEGGEEQQKGNSYEVFLSFRGTDTRKGFTDHLYTNLVNAGIHVFRDDNELRVGEEIGLELLHSITQSQISIPIISENYASSKWCLRELAEMLKCRRSKGQIVLPIFYKVGPSQVRDVAGRLRDAINTHKGNMDEVKGWEEALKEVKSLKGWESNKIDNGHEAALVAEVVGRVMSELKRLFQLNVPEQLVGIDDRVEQILKEKDSWKNGTWIIGIYGMGGIGKTTLAKVLYNKLSIDFEGRSFVANIRETFKNEGIKCLQKQLISSITRKPCDVSNVDEGIGFIKSQFSNKKCLILLDDIDDNNQLKALTGDGNWFKAGSIVIITTRNRNILDEAKARLYPLNELPFNQSLILFCRHAFGEDSPPSDYEDISHAIVSTTGRLPLALEVMGSFLHGKAKETWNDALKKLKKVPDKKVQESLRISYDTLDKEVQQIYLDIACFFIGSSKEIPTYMWDVCSFLPAKGIEVLILTSLIEIEKDDKLMMHDQLRDLGREIVRLENEEKPQERSRLWDKEEAKDVLDNNKGTCKIEALQIGNGRGRRYTSEQFKELTNLRFLQMEFADLVGDFQNLLPNLRWLRWQPTSRNFEAVNFHLEKLAVLDLSKSGISKDWGGWGPLKLATKLKVLNLSKCLSLRRTPDLSAFKSMEIMILEDCKNLEEIHPSIGDIKTLISLNVKSCHRLKELPVGVGRMEELRELILDGTAIQEIPISRDYWKKLKTLSASGCERLAQLPESLGSLGSLTRLNLSSRTIKELPESLGSLVSLTQLNLCATGIKELPKSIDSLKKLETLNASYCASLAHIPSSLANLTSLRNLLLCGCGSLTEIPDSIHKSTSLTKLDLRWTKFAELSIGKLQI
ncbi:disease resistance protein L6-like isoform X2 [Rhodamnia argentea]|uniref:Disease resistance protein L6-like isoform X2 n=1 Tax=Rhodamnia argentea TaxID=178133 RepID=A0ABM3H8R2_9MYRT|nr:disease resistance protein L6-like isoform X2 [Rhodamnia argentea]